MSSLPRERQKSQVLSSGFLQILGFCWVDDGLLSLFVLFLFLCVIVVVRVSVGYSHAPFTRRFPFQKHPVLPVIFVSEPRVVQNNTSGSRTGVNALRSKNSGQIRGVL